MARRLKAHPGVAEELVGQSHVQPSSYLFNLRGKYNRSVAQTSNKVQINEFHNIECFRLDFDFRHTPFQKFLCLDYPIENCHVLNNNYNCNTIPNSANLSQTRSKLPLLCAASNPTTLPFFRQAINYASVTSPHFAVLPLEAQR